MISEATLLGKLLTWIINFFKVEYVSNTAKANSYVSEVLKHVKEIVESSDLSDQKVAYSHEVVKKLYSSVASSIGDIVSSNDLAKVRQALAAARVYYWVRFYTGKPGDEIIDIINDRIKRIRRGEVRHNSNEYIIKKILDLNSQNPNLIGHEIDLIHSNCLADIAELEELHLSVVTTKIRKW